MTNARGGILDFSAATDVDASSEATRTLASLPVARSLMHCTRVILAPSDNIYRAMRVFEMETQGTRPNLHLVRTRREAQAILGVQKLRFTEGEPS
jgi:hypothetical protein